MGVLDNIRQIFTRSAALPAVAALPTAKKKPQIYATHKETYDALSSPGMAMKISAVYRCIDILSKSVASIPLEAKIKIAAPGGGYFVYDENNPVNYLLSVKPNNRQTAFEFMQSIIVQMMTRGNAYVYPQRVGGTIRNFILLIPGSVSYDALNNRYTIADTYNGVSGVYGAEDIIHIKNLSLDGGMTGVSTITYAAKVLAISANADEEQNDTFKRGGSVRGFVSGNAGGLVGLGTPGDDQVDDVAEKVEKQMASGRDIFGLTGEMKFNQISLSAADIQLLESKQFNVFEICRFFGVHPDKVFAQQTGNYKASEMSQVAFLTDTLQPILLSIQNAFAAKLISPATYGKITFEFNPESILKTDLTTHADYMAKTIAAGVRTVNYWRRKCGEAPVQWGDEVLVSANLVPLDSEKLWGAEGDTAPDNA